MRAQGYWRKGQELWPPRNEGHRQQGGEQRAWVPELLRPAWESSLCPFLAGDLGQLSAPRFLICTRAHNLCAVLGAVGETQGHMFTALIALPFSKRRQVTEVLERETGAEDCRAVIGALTWCRLHAPAHDRQEGKPLSVAPEEATPLDVLRTTGWDFCLGSQQWGQWRHGGAVEREVTLSLLSSFHSCWGCSFWGSEGGSVTQASAQTFTRSMWAPSLPIQGRHTKSLPRKKSREDGSEKQRQGLSSLPISLAVGIETLRNPCSQLLCPLRGQGGDGGTGRNEVVGES